MTCNETRTETLNQNAEQILRSIEMMARLAEAMGRVNEWADDTSGVPKSMQAWFYSQM